MTALPAGGSRVFIGDINKDPYFRIETYQTTEGQKYIMVDYPSDADAVHSIYLSSLKSEPMATQEFVDFIQSLGGGGGTTPVIEQDALYLRSPNKLWKITMTDLGEFRVDEVQ